MMKQNIGDTWGYVRVTDIRMETRHSHDGAVSARWGEKTIHLKCQCGKEFSLPYEKFPGRRALKDCGCGIAVDRVSEDLRTSQSIYIEMELLKEITRWAFKNGVSTSKAIVTLAKIGLVDAKKAAAKEK
jgi:hypothetical protein